jgi:HSP20 family molecular chaperone IbpA
MQHIESHIYPGEYVPKEEIDDNLKVKSKENCISNCLVNIAENKTHLEIAVCLPGMNKQDITVELKKNNIMIYVNQFKNGKQLQKEKFLMHEFENSRMFRRIKLPQHADLTFISATFQHGILRLHIPKGNNHVYGKPHFVAIY